MSLAHTSYHLNRLSQLPPGFLDARATDLLDLLGAPTLIELAGRRPEPLFVSVLLHGNEDTGFAALLEVLRNYQSRELPRSLMVFIGNVDAAARVMRSLPGQADFNRCWPGTENPDTPEAALMNEVMACARERKPFASIDIHNNTGINPHYSCVTRPDAGSLYLASLFSRVAVLFDRPLGVQSAAMASLCPAISVECGVVGAQSGVQHAAQLIEAALHLAEIPTRSLIPRDFELLQTTAIVKVPPYTSFSFDDEGADIRFRSDIDHLNFSELPAGTVLARTSDPTSTWLEVVSAATHETDADQFKHVFSYEHGEIRFSQAVIPAMLTRDSRAIRADCLCYLMRRIDPGAY